MLATRGAAQAPEAPYRVIQCCTGDIGVKNASMMDIETWMPSRFDGKDSRQRLRRDAQRIAPLRVPGEALEPALQGR
jgi:hypothetical protein